MFTEFCEVDDCGVHYAKVAVFLSPLVYLGGGVMKKLLVMDPQSMRIN